MPAEVGLPPPPPLRRRRGWRPGHGLRWGAAKELGRVQEQFVAWSGRQVAGDRHLAPPAPDPAKSGLLAVVTCCLRTLM